MDADKLVYNASCPVFGSCLFASISHSVPTASFWMNELLKKWPSYRDHVPIYLSDFTLTGSSQNSCNLQVC